MRRASDMKICQDWIDNVAQLLEKFEGIKIGFLKVQLSKGSIIMHESHAIYSQEVAWHQFFLNKTKLVLLNCQIYLLFVISALKIRWTFVVTKVNPLLIVIRELRDSFELEDIIAS